MKRFYACVAAALIPCLVFAGTWIAGPGKGSHAAVSTALYSDTFTGSNTSPLPGWTDFTGEGEVFKRASNAAAPASGNNDAACYPTGATAITDQYAKANVTITSTLGGDQGIGVIVRGSTTQRTYYSLIFDGAASNNVSLGETVNNGFAARARYTATYVAGAVLELRAVGDQITAIYNGTTLGTYTDPSPIASGVPGIRESSTSTGAFVDNFEADTIP
jgi:hypothetical protein